MTAVLEITGLHAGYLGTPVVRDLDLKVEEGEVVALLGPNGAGKTTTLLTMSGMLPIIEGDISCSASRSRASGRTSSPASGWPTCPRIARCSST